MKKWGFIRIRPHIAQGMVADQIYDSIRNHQTLHLTLSPALYYNGMPETETILYSALSKSMER